MFHVEHSVERTVENASNCFGFKLRQKLSGAPKSVIANACRFDLFCAHLWILRKLNGTYYCGSQPEGRRWQDYDRHQSGRVFRGRAEVNTLLVDCDPQSNATSGLGLVRDPERLNTYHLLMGAAGAEQALQRTELEQLWMIPSHKNLIGANLELVDGERREFRLRDALEPLREKFQFVVLDCPPALDLLTVNALVAADSGADSDAGGILCAGGDQRVDRTRSSGFKAGLNPELTIEGVVLTMLDDRTSLAQAGDGGVEDVLRRKAVHDDDPAEHTAGGGAQSREARAALRRAVARGRELYPAGEGDYFALLSVGGGGGSGRERGDREVGLD